MAQISITGGSVRMIGGIRVGETGEGFSIQTAITQAGLTSKMAFDAGDADSYDPGVQTAKWLDLSGNGYDFYRGDSGVGDAGEPTFTGTAGDLTDSTYWAFDGADWFTYDSANETFMQNWHKGGANPTYTFIAMFYLGVAAIPASSPEFISGPHTATDHGMGFAVNASTTKLEMRGYTASVKPLDKRTDDALSSNAWHFVAVSIDEAGGDVSYLYVDGDYAQVDAADTFDADYATASTSAASGIYHLTSTRRPDLQGTWPTDWKLMAFANIDSFVSKTDMDAVFEDVRFRMGI